MMPMNDLRNPTANVQHHPSEAERKQHEQQEYIHHKTHPMPPYSNKGIKLCTVLIILVLISLLGVYVGLVSRDFIRDGESPKVAVKVMNKEGNPVYFPAITACNINDRGPDSNDTVPFVAFRDCIVLNNFLNGTNSNKSCVDTTQYKTTWNGVYLSCWSVNMKGANHTEPYKSYAEGFFNSIFFSFDTSDVFRPVISITLHKWDKVPTVEELLAPYTFTTVDDLAILPIQQIDYKPIKGDKYTTWDVVHAHLKFGANSTGVQVYYRNLEIVDQKEGRTYKTVSLIGDIAAAFEILLGLSVFKLWLIIVAGFLLYRSRRNNSNVHSNPGF